MLLPQYAKIDINPAFANRLLGIANRAADAAAVPSLANFRQALQIDNKEASGGFDPVTIADRQAEQAIKNTVLAEFPQHGFFGEESERKIANDQPLWIVDPIDGTRSYITGMPLWGTLIAVYDGVDVVLGLLDQPVLKERFVATRYAFSAQSACTSQLLTPGARRDLGTSSKRVLGEAIVQTTAPEFFLAADSARVFEALKQSVSMVRYGGDCYCYALLAMGFVDIVIEAGLAPYDIAALIPIVEGAGGVVTTWDGNSAVSGGSVLACANVALHEQVMAIIQSSGK